MEKDVILDVKSEIKKIMESKNNFYHLLNQKMAPSKPMQELEYDHVVNLHTADPYTQRVTGISNTRNLNRLGKAASEQRPRKVIDYNEKASGIEDSNYTSIAQNTHNYMKRPINYNTSRLPGLLYQNLESSLDYYDSGIRREKFLVNYCTYPQRLGELGHNVQMKKYDHIIKNKRYEKLL